MLLSLVHGAPAQSQLCPGSPPIDTSGPSISNQTLSIRHGSNLGGAIVSVAENANGANIINNHDSGRQLQCAVWADPYVAESSGGWNPTQAGDGPLMNTDVKMFNGANYIYSRTTPVLWNFGTPDPCILVPVPLENL